MKKFCLLLFAALLLLSGSGCAWFRSMFNEPERQPVAFNCINQVYQCITDSTTFYFDTEKTLKSIGNAPTNDNEAFLKAVLQSYSESLTNKKYTVSSSLSE